MLNQTPESRTQQAKSHPTTEKQNQSTDRARQELHKAPQTQKAQNLGISFAVHWGNLGGDINEGTLKEACATGNDNIVIINSLLVHDDGTTPELELPGHCGNTSYPLHQARVTSSILPKPKYPSLTFHLEVLKNILIIITISLLILP